MPWDALPGERIAYDLDGSMGTFSLVTDTDRGVRVLAQKALEGLNADRSKGLFLDSGVMSVLGDSTGNGSFNSGYLARPWIAIIFPTPMRLRGVFASVRIGGGGTTSGSPYVISGNMRTAIEVSFDTTNGEDGTWTLLTNCWGATGSQGLISTSTYGYTDAIDQDGLDITPIVGGTPVQILQNYVASYRHTDAALSANEYGVKAVSGVLTRNVKGVRVHLVEFSGTNYPQTSWTGQNYRIDIFTGLLANLHLYGEPDTNAVNERLEFVTADGIAVKNFEWGDVTHGQVITQTFKVRNLSTTNTASSINLSVTLPNPGNSPNPSLELSLDGVVYSSSLSLSSINPGFDSAIIYLRLTVPGEGLLGGFTPRILVEVGSWT